MSNLSINTVEALAGFDGKTCKVNPKMAYDGKSSYLLHYTMLDLKGSDVFSDSYASFGTDPFDHSVPIKVFEPFYDEKYKYVYFENVLYYSGSNSKFFGFGIIERFVLGTNIVYKNDLGTYGSLVMRIYDFENGMYSDGYIDVPFPFETGAVCPHAQVIENDNGEMLLSFQYCEKGTNRYSVITILYKFEENKLNIVKVGTPIIIDNEKYVRGIFEPSVIKHGGKYYITLRTDSEAFYAVSDDGFDFSAPKPHVFEDGSLIGSYNTMTRWVSIGGNLYLVYTRKNGHNDHVFRNRAPLYITRFDPENGCLIRSEEQIVAPEKGARLGNFSVCDCGNKYIVTVAEWMQTNPPDPFDYTVCQRYGSNNRIWISEIKGKD